MSKSQLTPKTAPPDDARHPNSTIAHHGSAKASLRDNPLICPGEVLNITTLPNDDRHFWVWYTPENKGRLFMEIPQKADVLLVLTDYYTYDMDPPAFPQNWWKEPTKT